MIAPEKYRHFGVFIDPAAPVKNKFDPELLQHRVKVLLLQLSAFCKRRAAIFCAAAGRENDASLD